MLTVVRSGFIEEGRQRKTIFDKGEWYDMILMAVSHLSTLDDIWAHLLTPTQVLEEEWMELRKKLPQKTAE